MIGPFYKSAVTPEYAHFAACALELDKRLESQRVGFAAIKSITADGDMFILERERCRGLTPTQRAEAEALFEPWMQTAARLSVQLEGTKDRLELFAQALAREEWALKRAPGNDFADGLLGPSQRFALGLARLRRYAFDVMTSERETAQLWAPAATALLYYLERGLVCELHHPTAFLKRGRSESSARVLAPRSAIALSERWLNVEIAEL